MVRDRVPQGVIFCKEKAAEIMCYIISAALGFAVTFYLFHDYFLKSKQISLMRTIEAYSKRVF